jgi:hypothetical protein
MWETYVTKAIEYSRGDIKELLDAELQVAGPLLVVTLNGIDAMGGIVYGFRKEDKPDQGNSRERSVTFMSHYMTIGCSQEALEVIYTALRCGMAHHCLPKQGAFGVDYHRLDNPVTEGRDGTLIVNAVALADRYLGGVSEVERQFQKGELVNRWADLEKDFPARTVTPRHSASEIAKGEPFPPLSSCYKVPWIPPM